jgi:hypothetical protein
MSSPEARRARVLLGLIPLSLSILTSCGFDSKTPKAPTQTGSNSSLAGQAGLLEFTQKPFGETAQPRSLFAAWQEFPAAAVASRWSLRASELVLNRDGQTELHAPLMSLMTPVEGDAGAAAETAKPRLIGQGNSWAVVLQGERFLLVELVPKAFKAREFSTSKATIQAIDSTALARVVDKSLLFLPSLKRAEGLVRQLEGDKSVLWSPVKLGGADLGEMEVLAGASCNTGAKIPCLLGFQNGKLHLLGPWSAPAKAALSQYLSSKVTASAKVPGSVPGAPSTGPGTMPPSPVPDPVLLEDDIWEKQVGPIMKTHCAGGGCHVDGMTTDRSMVIANKGSISTGIEGKLVNGEMPPVFANAVQKSIDTNKKDTLLKWLRAQGM